MDFLWQSVIGGLAAVGFICILRAMCDIIYMKYYRVQECAELYISADGSDVRVLHLLGAAVHVRKVFLKGVQITFVDTCTYPQVPNYAAQFCDRFDIIYYP